MSRDPADGQCGGSERTFAPEPRYMVVGRVLRPHGVGGEVRVEILTAYPERLSLHKHLFLGFDGQSDEPHRHKVERLRRSQRSLLLKLAGYDSRDDAEQLRDMLLQIPITDATPLENGEYYLYQIIGASVETDEGEQLGSVVEVIETGANDVFVVRSPSAELLVPAINEVVLDLDLEERRIVVHLPPGLRAEHS